MPRGVLQSIRNKTTRDSFQFYVTEGGAKEEAGNEIDVLSMRRRGSDEDHLKAKNPPKFKDKHPHSFLLKSHSNDSILNPPATDKSSGGTLPLKRKSFKRHEKAKRKSSGEENSGENPPIWHPRTSSGRGSTNTAHTRRHMGGKVNTESSNLEISSDDAVFFASLEDGGDLFQCLLPRSASCHGPRNKDYLDSLESSSSAYNDLESSNQSQTSRSSVFFSDSSCEAPRQAKSAYLRRSLSEIEDRRLQRPASPGGHSPLAKSVSLKDKKSILMRFVKKRSLKKDQRSNSEGKENEGGPWQRRQPETAGGSAPTSPQTGAKLPKRPFWKRGISGGKDKGSHENSQDSLADRDANASSPLPFPCFGSPAHSTDGSVAYELIQPNLCIDQNEILRQINSMKIWLQEAKDIPDKRCYYCAVYVNEHEESRTTTKLKDGLCFWGEQFEIKNLPEQSFKVGLRLMREDKPKPIGTAEFRPEPMILEPRLDQWIYLSPDKVNKEKETPAIRYKYYFQSITVLPLAEYSSFIKYLSNSSLILCKKLETHLDVKAKEDVVKSLICVLQYHGKAVSFLAQLIISDVEEKGGRDEIIFRGNSMATKAIEAYMKLLSKEYLEIALKPTITHLLRSSKDIEVDPTKIPPTETLNIQERQRDFQKLFQEAWDRILKSAQYFPIQLREVFYAVKERIKRRELTDHLISACVFLRLLCPAILSPYLFSLIKEYPEPSTVRRLTLLAKTLQTLANFTTFQSKETCMQFLNDYIEREQDSCKTFIEEISCSGPPKNDQKLEGEKIDVGKHLALLHLHLKHSLSLIEPQSMDSELRRLNRQIEYISDCLERHKIVQQQEINQAPSNAVFLTPKRDVMHSDIPLGKHSPSTQKKLFSHFSRSERTPASKAPSQHTYETVYTHSPRDKYQTSISHDPSYNSRIPASDLSTSHTFVPATESYNNSNNNNNNNNPPTSRDDNRLNGNAEDPPRNPATSTPSRRSPMRGPHSQPQYYNHNHRAVEKSISA